MSTIRSKCVLFAALCVHAVSLSGCAPESNEVVGGGNGVIHVFTTIPPHGYFAERIGGDRVIVHVLVKPGHSAETYEVTPRQVDELSRARVYFRAGMPFEVALLKKLESVHPALRVVDLRDGVPLLTMDGDPFPADGDPGEADPHAWLDPIRAHIQAQTMARTFSALMPESAREFEENLAAFSAELDGVNAELTKRLAPFHGRTVYVVHPAFGYLLGRHGLVQSAVERDGKMPGPRHLDALIAAMRAERVKTVFTEAQSGTRHAAAIAEAIGAHVVTLDPLAADYLENLRSMGKAIARALGS